MQGFPPKFTPIVEGMEIETMEQLATTDSHVEGILVTESEEEICSFENPSTPMIVEQPFVEYTTFHFEIEGQPGARDWVFTDPSNDTVASEFGPMNPLWETYLGQAISEYGTTNFPYVTPL